MDADSEKAPHNKGFHLQYLFFDRTLWAFIQFFPLQVTGKINARRYLDLCSTEPAGKNRANLKVFSHAVTNNKAFLKDWPLLQWFYFIKWI